MTGVIKTGSSGVYTGMDDIKQGDIIEVWTGAALGSAYPPQPGDRWDAAEVVEVRGGSCQINWKGPRPGMPWVPMTAVRKLPGIKQV